MLKNYSISFTKEATMRTTLDLPKNLMDNAMKITKEKTKTGLIIKALQNIIQKNKIQKLKKYQGKVNLPINLDKLRERK